MDHEQKMIVLNAGGQRDAFAGIYGEWLKVRGQSEAETDSSETDIEARLERESDLARMIWAMPATVKYQIIQKISVLEHYRDDSDWRDQRDLRLIASIKADLIALSA